ncbi:chemotaxis protein CheA [Terasakiispira papahanaumokuakeensis]|uniref:Chemotaxis protein CheA n=1 Tax=Terasakiispira papahanaumokuakeensis TaxID=197479 RepID=A0A1E2V8H2_9GAMM|nr:chemotaxis protein CheA [Terasakiispira papahanaumokuakeensis]ODC03281.1 chemotaxis protein CheA [Terasakiispira papahanaumokuakeensis]
MTDPVQVFREEAEEHLSTLELALLELEETPDDHDQIAAAFRAMHTIKGAAGMVGFDHLSEFTHHLESFFDQVRNGKIHLSAEYISILLEARDHIFTLLDNPDPNEDARRISGQLAARFSQQVDQASSEPEVVSPSSQQAHEHIETEVEPFSALICYQITIIPDSEAFRDGFDLLPLLRELNELGDYQATTYLSVAGFSAVGHADSRGAEQGHSELLGSEPLDPSAFDPEQCVLTVVVELTTALPKERIDDVFFFVIDDWSIDIQATPLSTPEATTLDATHSMTVEDEDGVVAHATAELTVPPSALSSESSVAQPRNPHQRSVRSETVSQKAPARAAATKGGSKSGTSDQSIRVPQSKLDALMDQVGELVILQASLDQVASEGADERLAGLAEELDRLVGNLRETTFDVRMLPIGSTFSRFRRLVRDLSKDLGKDVAFETAGAETELDKVVIDRLADPLVHLLRNSLDHGIESPDVREAQGKPRRGLLRLEASQHQGQIHLNLSDDGAGLNREAILSRALDRGVVRPGHDLTDQEINQLIFEPGFSTAKVVSDVSGRGVGMDVVKRSIEGLQGRVYLESETGIGTTVKITLPMTLAIIDGLMVGVSSERYVLPLSIVEECMETSSKDISRENGIRLVRHRDGLVPCLRLRDSFSVAGTQPNIEQTILVRVGEERFGITVDQVIGNFQTVIKSLGHLYQGIKGVMGATIMGNGSIAMILDVAELMDETNV